MRYAWKCLNIMKNPSNGKVFFRPIWFQVSLSVLLQTFQQIVVEKPGAYFWCHKLLQPYRVANTDAPPSYKCDIMYLLPLHIYVPLHKRIHLTSQLNQCLRWTWQKSRLTVQQFEHKVCKINQLHWPARRVKCLCKAPANYFQMKLSACRNVTKTLRMLTSVKYCVSLVWKQWFACQELVLSKTVLPKGADTFPVFTQPLPVVRLR